MKITNKAGLPEAFVEGVRKEKYSFTPNSYSATTIIHHPTEILLQRRHDDEIEQDAVEMLNMIFGTAVHSWLERWRMQGTIVEMYLKTEILPNHFLSGKLDMYNPETKELVDWKTGSVYKYLKNDFSDWYIQGMVYVYLLEKNGYQVDKVSFWCFLKDWSARELRKAKLNGDRYPEVQAFEFKFNVTDDDRKRIEDYIKNWFDLVVKLENLPDEELVYCGDENTWYTGDSYAIYKYTKGVQAARALRVFKTFDEANEFLEKTDVKDLQIVTRKGEYRKCEDYCSCCKWCKHYRDKVANNDI